MLKTRKFYETTNKSSATCDSLTYFLSMLFHNAGTSPRDHIPVVKVEMKFQDNDDQANNPSNSEDEEG